MKKTINGSALRKMVINGTKLLDMHKEHVDALNVFPVPDGDTGTNMGLTMVSCAKEVSGCLSNDMDAVCECMSRGALRGARGNSGVILSQIIKGIATTLASGKEVTVKKMAKALEAGTSIAYKAVTKPKEGTILTVMRAMSEAAATLAKKVTAVDEFLLKVIEAGEDMLKQTPEMLPILKKAGVVDAGGRGLLIIFKGFYNSLIDLEETSMAFEDSFGSGESASFNAVAHFDYTDLGEIEFAYCTEFFVVNLKKKTTEAAIDKFRETLMTLGDSVLVIGDLSMIKVHVHTNEPGVALTHALQLGEVDKIKIDNMLEQNRALMGQKTEDLKPFGMVSICAGTGLAGIFKDLVVDVVVEGGQTMNPSAADIADACDSIAAKDIFIFPNNKNIILAAEQAKALTKRTIHVLPAKNVPQGLSAVLAFDAENSLEENLLAMHEAMGEVKSGAVTYAVRNTRIDKFDLKEGDIIGLDASNIVAKGNSVDKVTEQLVDSMMDSRISNISLYFGNNVKEEEAQNIADGLAEKYTRCDVDIHFGGQPLYYYIVSLE